MTDPSSVTGTRRMLEVSVCFFQLTSAGWSTAHEGKSQITDPMNCSIKTTLKHCAPHAFTMLVCKLYRAVFFTPPLCPQCFFIGYALALPLDSASSPAAARGVTSLELWVGRRERRRGPQGMWGGLSFMSMLVIWGSITLWRQHWTISSHPAITQQDMRGEKSRNLYGRQCDF